MRRTLKIILWLAIAAVAAAATYAWLNKDRIVRLYNVNTLFDEDRIVGNFSGMRDLFFFRDMKRAGETIPWPETPRELPGGYSWQGEERKIADFLTRTSTTSLLVIHDGSIASEEYFLGTKAEDKRISWSMAKSFLSAMFGMAVADGRIASLDDPVDKYVATLKGTVYEGATIRNVLNMASGVKFDEDYLDFWSDINRMGRVLALGGSMDAFAAGLEARERPQGELRQYTSIDTHILGMVLRSVTGKDLPELMQETLMGKLGFEDDAYYLTDGYGVAFALGGLNMRTRDYARFGQMMLDEGRFNGVQVVPQDWAVESVEASAPKASDPNDPFGYGYQWWVPVNSDGEFYAIGIYGQFIYVNRPVRVVIVKTSADRKFRDDGASGSVIEAETIEMFRAIASAVSGWTPKTMPN
jgi:CubicO group peptidase (beta-lactamase class C family)